MNITTLELKLSSYVSDNLKQLKEAAYNGLLGWGKPVILSEYNYSTKNRKTKFTRVLSFDQTKETPDLIENITADYYILEVNKEINWHTKLELIVSLFEKEEGFPSIVELGNSVQHDNPSVKLIKEALWQTKGKTITSASCSHHSGYTKYSVISLGKEGAAVCHHAERENLSYDDIEELPDDVWKSCDGNLYNLVGLNLNPSVKSNSEIKGEVIRKLSEEEKTYLKEIYSSDLEFED